MRKSLFLILILFNYSLWAMSFKHAGEIYQKLLITNGVFGPQLVYSPSSEVNASCGYYKITINAGILRFVRNDAEMALVLGHELAHYRLGHAYSTPEHEYAADKLGAFYMSKTGYNVCSGAQVIKRFNSPDSVTHPNSDNRFKELCHK